MVVYTGVKMKEEEKIKKIFKMLERGAGADILKTQSEVIFGIMDLSYYHEIHLDQAISDYHYTFIHLYGPKQNTQKKTP